MINWWTVGDRAKQTTTTIRALLDYHDIRYRLINADAGGVYLFTDEFGIEIDADGMATYALEDERPKLLDKRPYAEPFVKVFSRRKKSA